MMPVDGVVLEGTAIIDASALTGEARPVERGAGDRVASGTVNVGAAFRMCAVARASESTYTGIVRLVEAAQQSKAPAARLHDSCLVDQDVPLFLDVFPPLTAPRQRCQAGATRAIDGCYWTRAPARPESPSGCSQCCRSGQEDASGCLRPWSPGTHAGYVAGESTLAAAPEREPQAGPQLPLSAGLRRPAGATRYRSPSGGVW
jgi:E1-E2 ATPase